MYALSRNLNRCRTLLRDLKKVSMDLTENPLNKDIYKCKRTLTELNLVRMNKKRCLLQNSNIVHLQQMLVASAYNLLLNEEGKEEEQFKIYSQTFKPLEAIQQLEMIVGRQIYVDLSDRIEVLKRRGNEENFQDYVMIDLQRETLDRILKELHYLARNKIKKEPE